MIPWPRAFDQNSDDDPAYVEAVEFMKTTRHVDGINYDWLWDYAKDLWKHRNAVFLDLDNKADNIVKYLGGGTGLFAVGVLARIDSTNYHLVFWTAPAIVAALCSVLLAMMARMPADVPSPPTIADAKREYADTDQDAEHTKAAFLGQWHLACEDMRLACKRKAKLVEWATYGYFAAIAFLVFPLGAGAIWPPLKP